MILQNYSRRLVRCSICFAVACVSIALLASCDGKPSAGEVVLYTSVDQPYAEPIAREFENRTGIHVLLVTDSEASKSVGLAERLRAEKANPQADVWWGNEPFHTINLAQEGLLAAYDSPAAADVNPMYRDPDHRWAGSGLRARVVAVSNQYTLPSNSVNLLDLQNPALKGKLAIARPTAGTTGGHVAALYTVWGDAKADAFFRALHANDIKLLGGNGPVAEAVGSGDAMLGITDNDDVASTIREGGKLHPVFPDQDGIGTLMLPCTVGLVTGAQHPDAARKLIDYLLSSEVEQKLINEKFVGWSVRHDPTDIKPMKLDYREAAHVMPQAVQRATALLEGRE